MPRIGEIKTMYRAAEDTATVEMFDAEGASRSLATIAITEADTKVTVGRVDLIVSENDWLLAVDGVAKTGGVIGK
jgi:hypothetical protein